MTELGFTCSEFSKGLSDCHAFDPALKQLVKLVTTCRDAPDVFSELEDGHSRFEPLRLNLLGNFVKFFNFCLSDTFDVEHLFLGATPNR